VAGFAATGQAKSTQQKKTYKLGISNTLVGNGWREGMICSIKAQALKSGQATKASKTPIRGAPRPLGPLFI
jgi:ribose transport system substrate-binding protein